MSRSRRHNAARISFTPNHSGVHLLSCPAVVDRLVRASGVGADDLVIDFGAGPGTITAPLAGTGAQVLAVERDPRFVAALRRRFADRPAVRVVQEDVRRVRLPRRAYTVVASIPFAVTTALLRRLLTPVAGGFDRAELVVEWGLARRLTASRPRDLEAAWWASRYELQLRRRVPARCFTPAPRVDAAHLSIRRRAEVDARTSSILWPLLGAVYRRPRDPAKSVLGDLVARRHAHRLLRDQNGTPAGDVAIGQWVETAIILARDKGIVAPSLPRSLR